MTGFVITPEPFIPVGPTYQGFTIEPAVDLSPEAGTRALAGYLAHTDKDTAMTEEPTCEHLPCKCDECAYGCDDEDCGGCKTCTYGCENRNCDCT
jgi:hypothetical protein